MKGYSKNSKYASQEEIRKLRESIEELGDISGIVHDLETDEIICGNQRADIIDINSRDICVVKRFPEPDKFGTVEFGYVEWEGKKYSFRRVRWSDAQRQKANLCANKMYSSYDYFQLAENFSKDILKESGFSSHEITMIFGKEVRSIVRQPKPMDGVFCRFGDEQKLIDKEVYDQWEENLMFENDYNNTKIETKLKNIIDKWS